VEGSLFEGSACAVRLRGMRERGRRAWE